MKFFKDVANHSKQFIEEACSLRFPRNPTEGAIKGFILGAMLLSAAVFAV